MSTASVGYLKGPRRLARLRRYRQSRACRVAEADDRNPIPSRCHRAFGSCARSSISWPRRQHGQSRSQHRSRQPSRVQCWRRRSADRAELRYVRLKRRYAATNGGQDESACCTRRAGRRVDARLAILRVCARRAGASLWIRRTSTRNPIPAGNLSAMCPRLALGSGALQPVG